MEIIKNKLITCVVTISSQITQNKTKHDDRSIVNTTNQHEHILYLKEETYSIPFSSLQSHSSTCYATIFPQLSTLYHIPRLCLNTKTISLKLWPCISHKVLCNKVIFWRIVLYYKVVTLIVYIDITNHSSNQVITTKSRWKKR